MAGTRPTIFAFGLLLGVITEVGGYNVDTRSPILATGPSGSYFGYSVALHREGTDDMMIVGAPLKDINIEGASNTGAVYRCSVTSPYVSEANCKIIELDKTAGENRTKSNQWLGATVRSSGNDGDVMSCAPFYKEHYKERKHPLLPLGIEVTGSCYISRNNFTTSSPHVVCPPPKGRVVEYNGFFSGSQCRAGMSGDFDEDGNFFLGAPGSFVHQGSIYVQTADATYAQTREKRFAFDGSLQGYSVAQGQFSDTGEINYVAGAPRASKMRGKVFIYSSDLSRSIYGISGDQTGAYFGHGVVASDLNGDGLDDLVVSAPNYWNREQGKPNAGQICIFYQNAEHKLTHDTFTVITGKISNGRFGFAITSLGDINDDGINDLAVGAPYDEDGAIFIYHGKRTKVETIEAQVLRPESFDVTGFLHFGYSISGGRDADKNEYPDLIVGDYSADKVLLVRTRPIIRPLFQLTFDPVDVDINSKDILIANQNYSGFNLTACMWYRGKGTPRSYNFSVRLTLDTDKQTPRALFNENREGRVEFIHENITKDRSWCRTMMAIMETKIADKINPIIVTIQATPILDEDLPLGAIHPVVDPNSRTEQSQIRIIAECVTKNCNPDLALNVQSDKDVLYMGDTTKVTLTVTVVNHGDEAFKARLHAKVHSSWMLSAYTPIQTALSIICKQSESDVQCDIGNPLPRRPTRLKFNMTFNVLNAPGDATQLSLLLLANSTNQEQENTTANNRQTLVFELRPKISVSINGSTNLDKFVFNLTSVDEEIANDYEAGEEIIHTYRVSNRGPGTIGNATLEVRWPMFVENSDEYLLYLTRVTLNTDDVCVVSGAGANPENLTLTVVDAAEGTDGRNVNRTEPIVSDVNNRQRRNLAEDDSSDNSDQSNEERPSEPMAQTQRAEVNVANCSGEYGGCVRIVCRLLNIPKGTDDIFLKIRSRLWSETMEKSNVFSWDMVSYASLVVHELPYVLQPTEGLNAHAMLALSVIPEVLKESQQAPLWAVLLSIFIALLLLILIVLILWKLGFFKRKKFEDDETAAAAVQEVE